MSSESARSVTIRSSGRARKAKWDHDYVTLKDSFGSKAPKHKPKPAKQPIKQKATTKPIKIKLPIKQQITKSTKTSIQPSTSTLPPVKRKSFPNLYESNVSLIYPNFCFDIINEQPKPRKKKPVEGFKTKRKTCTSDHWRKTFFVGNQVERDEEDDECGDESDDDGADDGPQESATCEDEPADNKTGGNEFMDTTNDGEDEKPLESATDDSEQVETENGDLESFKTATVGSSPLQTADGGELEETFGNCCMPVDPAPAEGGDDESMDTPIDDDESVEAVKLRVIADELECPIDGCIDMVADRFKLAEHYIKVHKCEPFRCMSEGCHESRETEGLLGMHIRMDHKRQDSWPCNKCDGIYRTHNLLYKHHWDLHFAGKFRCALPGCAFGPVRHRFIVRAHYAKVHDAGKYSCRFCPKRFNNSATKTNHERSHTDTRPFSCKWPNCTHATPVRFSLVTHIRAAHFKVPRTLKKQRLLNRFDPDDVDKWIEVNDELKNLRNFDSWTQDNVRPVVGH